MPLSTQAQTIVDAFTAGLTADQRGNVNAAFRDAPELTRQINAAVASGDLRGFALLPAGTNAGGQYNPTARTMELPASILTSPAAPARFDPAELVFVTGHEVQHAINRPTQQAATNAFVGEVNRIAATPQTAHDYTAALATRLASHRQDEASAHIAGFNATVSMVRTSHSGATPTLEQIFRASPGRMSDFITQSPGTPPSYALRSGLTLQPDMTISPTAANVEAMGRHYYDMPASQARIGHNGDSNYQNYYAGGWVGYVAQVERAHAANHVAQGRSTELQLNLSALGLTEAQLERNGVNLGPLGGRQAYVDIGTNPSMRGHFDHTQGTYQHVPIAPTPPAPTMDQPGHPDHALYRSGREAVERLEAGLGRSYDATSEKLAQSAAVLARKNDFERVDHVLLSIDNGRGVRVGEHLFVVQGRVDDPAHLRAMMRTNEAIARTPEQNAAMLVEAREQQAQRAAAQQQETAQVATREAPVRSVG